jgi:hypothetical protein
MAQTQPIFERMLSPGPLLVSELSLVQLVLVVMISNREKSHTQARTKQIIKSSSFRMYRSRFATPGSSPENGVPPIAHSTLGGEDVIETNGMIFGLPETRVCLNRRRSSFSRSRSSLHLNFGTSCSKYYMLCKKNTFVSHLAEEAYVAGFAMMKM